MVKNLKIVITFILVFILQLGTNVHADEPIKNDVVTTYPSVSLRLDEHLVPLETPLIKKQNTLYFPLNDLITHLNAKISFNRRKNLYEAILKKPKIVSQFILGSKEVWINDLQQFMSQPSITYNNRLYIPLFSFLKLSGFSWDDQEETIVISRSKKAPVVHHKIGVMDDEEDLTVIASIDIPSPPVLDQKPPSMETLNEWAIQVGENRYAMQELSFYDRRHLYVDLESFFKNEGYDITYTDSEIILEKDFATLRFSLYELAVHISTGYKEKTVFLDHPIIQRGRAYFYPLFSLIKILDFTPHWNKDTHTLALLKNIRHIRVVKDEFDYKLQIFSSQGIVNATPVKTIMDDDNQTENYNELLLKLPLTQITETQSLTLDQSPISSLAISKAGTTMTHISLKLRKSVQAAPITKTDFGTELAFKTSVKSIRQIEQDDKLTIQIQTNGPFKFKSWYEKNMFIVDIPDTINQLPQIVRTQHDTLRRIRTSQLTRDPLKTRLVFHISERIKIQRNRKDPQTLELVFPVQKQIVAKKKLPTTKRGIARKIIFIDPGHGGRDPGAVINRKIYEKKYTLDISKRLERKLKQSGAYVVMGRKGDENPSLRRRVVVANRNKADAFISIHINSFTQPVGRGTETYYYKQSEKKLASLIHNNLTKSLKLRNNGLKRTGFYVLRYSKMPSVLVEPLFMTNPKEFKLLETAEFREKIADSIFQGLVSYFN